MDAFELLVESLRKWIKETTERIPAAQPSLNTEELKKPLEDTLVRHCRDVKCGRNNRISINNIKILALRGKQS